MNYPSAYSSPHSMPRANHTAYQSNYRDYTVSKLPHRNYSVPTVSTVPENTVITVPVAGPHMKVPTPQLNHRVKQVHTDLHTVDLLVL